MSPQILNTVGLSMGMLGVAIIYFWGPPLPDFSETVNIIWSDPPAGSREALEIDTARARKRRHQILSGIGLGLIFLGFAIQLWAVWAGYAGTISEVRSSAAPA